MADDDVPRELPYRAEYAKSGVSKCKSCKSKIEKNELRLAVMVQNRHADVKMTNWFHFICFFEKINPKSVGDIEHFEQLSVDDQEKIEKRIGSISDKTRIQDFKVEYAKSGLAECIACQEKIAKEQVRIGKIDHESDISMRFNPIYRWHHVDCFVKVRQKIGFFEPADKIPNFVQLEAEDRDLLRKQIPAIKPQKRKGETNDGAGSSKKMKQDLDSSQMKDQMREMFAIRTSIQELFEDKSKKNHVQIIDLVRLLEKNGQAPLTGLQNVLERVSEMLYFGPLEKCKSCGTGQLVYRGGNGYQCDGYKTGFTKCLAINNDPERKRKLKIPDTLSQVPYFLNFKFEPKKRIIQAHAAPVEGQTRENFVVLTKEPLKDLKFYLCESNEDLKGKIETFGGIVLESKSNTAAAFVATKEYMKSEDEQLTFAMANLIPVLDAKFINQISETCVPMDVLRKHLLSDWCGESLFIDHLKENYPQFAQKKKSFREEKENKRYDKKMPKVKLTVKGGTVVDPDSKLADVGHILNVGKLIYSCVLNRFSLEDNKNSYYKLQIIELDDRSSYHVFRSWGRIGTIIGDTKSQEFYDKKDAIDNFNEVYRDKTRNQFGQKYVKVPGFYVPMEIDFSEGKSKKAPSSTVTSSSKLDPGVQELITLIFDRANMIKTMAKFDLDLSKMPLGKLSRSQLLAGLSILKEAEELITADKDEQYKKTMFNDLTNKFFTLCPQNFGVRRPPILNNLDLIREKDEMLENLLEIELAYDMLMTSGGGSEIDANYAKLKCGLSLLDVATEEYKAIQKYVQNTHGATHDDFKLAIENVYIVNRENERKRFEPFKRFPNRKLLWHGSRSTNFAGIFSHGLKIAPKEAPATGYMFGKGIYFADMVSKSANYCHADPSSGESGILLLCEVALGNMWELKDAKYVEKLPEGKNSVKGNGTTYPSPKDVFILEDGVQVPYGKATKFLGDGGGNSLFYNEYIVYDMAQVNIRYAVKLKFNEKN